MSHAHKDWFHSVVTLFGHAPAIYTHNTSISYNELDKYVDKCVLALRRAGFKPGVRIAFLPQQDVSSIVLFLACLRLNAYPCPLNPKSPANTVDAACTAMRAGFLTAYDLSGGDFMLSGKYTNVTNNDYINEIPGTTVALQTSASSGKPKPVILTTASLEYNATLSNKRTPLNAGDTWLLSLPLYHISGVAVLFRCFIAGAAIMLPHENNIGAAILSSQVTHLSVVPTQLLRLVREKCIVDTLRKMQAILLGGGPPPVSLLTLCGQEGLPVRVTYGMTEAASQIATACPGDPWSTCGYPLEPENFMITNTGEIAIRGPSLFQGYLRPDGTLCRDEVDGWFYTGDIGRLDEAGRLIISGRKDNRFVSRGENIYPEKIENILASLDNIEEAIVVPVPHPEHEQVPVAFIHYGENSQKSDEMIRKELREHVPGFMIPAAFLPWPVDLIIDTSLKVNRSYLTRLAHNEVSFHSKK